MGVLTRNTEYQLRFDHDRASQMTRDLSSERLEKAPTELVEVIGGSLQPFNYLNCIWRLGSGEKQLVVSGVNDATKGGITPRTFKAITFKSALVDMWCDTSIETKMQAAIWARHDLE
jgi:hypothetical protein